MESGQRNHRPLQIDEWRRKWPINRRRAFLIPDQQAASAQGRVVAFPGNWRFAQLLTQAKPLIELGLHLKAE
jgi:hypothetical protein